MSHFSLPVDDLDAYHAQIPLSNSALPMTMPTAPQIQRFPSTNAPRASDGCASVLTPFGVTHWRVYQIWVPSECQHTMLIFELRVKMVTSVGCPRPLVSSYNLQFIPGNKAQIANYGLRLIITVLTRIATRHIIVLRQIFPLYQTIKSTSVSNTIFSPRIHYAKFAL